MDRILTEVTVTETRDLRYGEIFLVKGGYIEIYNTTGLNNCPPQLWDALELEAIKTQFDAQAVQLNGPKFWMMDSQTLSFGETLSFGGLEARWAATLDAALVGKQSHGTTPYTVFFPNNCFYFPKQFLEVRIF